MAQLVPVPVNTAQAVQFNHATDLVWIGLQLIPVAVALAFLATGLGARLAARLQGLARGRRYPALVALACLMLAVCAVLSLPLSFYGDVVLWRPLARQWGFPPPNPGPWLTGRATGLLGQCLAAALLLWIPFGLVARLPRTWWIWVTVAGTTLATTAVLTSQLVVAPMTTRFEPLAEPALKTAFEAMAARCGASGAPVLVGGDDATVVGLGPTSRILIPSPRFERETPAQLRTTLAHELKHYRMGDNWKAFGVVAGLILLGALLVQLLGMAAIRLWGRRLGVASLSEPGALPLIVLILALAWPLAGKPAFNAIQQHVEFEADRFALEVTHDNRALGEWQAAVGKQPWRLNEYDWFTATFLATHPSQAERVRLANSYHPWETGHPGVYGATCRPAS